MTDEHIREAYYLVTYEWRSLGRHSSHKWRRENAVIKGCPAIWWSERLMWYKNREEAYKEKLRDYAERGAEVPLSEKESSEEMRFLFATPITRCGFAALDGVVG